MGLGEQWRNTTTMGFPDMVIVGTGLRSVSICISLCYNGVGVDSSVRGNVGGWSGGRAGDGDGIGVREHL